ncbi:MAG: xanthine dehydrogenase family protein subunit M [Dehalococcoidia bacterium]|nr:xanthine dehydrogenase family protein subunit M [Dehalococcoidia bacterium]
MGKYILAQTLEEALDALETYRDKARVISGGTDLLPLIKSGGIKVDCIVDITNITGLNYIDYDNKLIRVGALVTHSDVESSPVINEKAVLLAEASKAVGSVQIRNRGTLVGNVVNASPASDTSVALIALGAEAKVVSKKGQRIKKVEELFVAPGLTNLGSHELVTELRFQGLGLGQGGAFIKLGRRQAVAISIVNVAVVLALDRERNMFSQARIGIGAVAPTPLRARRVEEALTRHLISDETIENASQEVMKEVRPISDIRGSADYRREMTSVLTARAIRRAIGRIK